MVLTTVVDNFFDRLVAEHIKECLSPFFDPHQYTYRANRSIADYISTALHATLTHLELTKAYIRMLIVNHKSDILVDKMADLDFPPATSAWNKDFLTNSPVCRIDAHSSSTQPPRAVC